MKPSKPLSPLKQAKISLKNGRALQGYICRDRNIFSTGIYKSKKGHRQCDPKEGVRHHLF